MFVDSPPMIRLETSTAFSFSSGVIVVSVWELLLSALWATIKILQINKILISNIAFVLVVLTEKFYLYQLDVNIKIKQILINSIVSSYSNWISSDIPRGTVILKEYFKNIPLKSCNIAKIYKAVRKVSKILQESCNVRSKHYKWNIAAILIFHFNIAVMWELRSSFVWCFFK